MSLVIRDIMRQLNISNLFKNARCNKVFCFYEASLTSVDGENLRKMYDDTKIWEIKKKWEMNKLVSVKWSKTSE